MRALAEVGLALVLLTHHHGDHVGGAAELAARFGAPIAAHANTAKPLARARDQPSCSKTASGSRDFECVFTPGHADGHLCFAREGFTIAGDMVAGLGTILIDPSEGDMTLYLALARAPARDAASHAASRTRSGDFRMATRSCASTSHTA